LHVRQIERLTDGQQLFHFIWPNPQTLIAALSAHIYQSIYIPKKVTRLSKECWVGRPEKTPIDLFNFAAIFD
jgi:hypothetical protein